MARPTVFLHVGTRKSGTTFLQLALRSSRAALADQGARLAVTTQDDFALVPPLRQVGDTTALRGAAAHLAARVAASRAERQIVTLEALAEMPHAVADEIVGALRGTGHEVRVVVTARHWGFTIPSEWQQQVKERSVQTYGDFLRAVRERAPEATTFLARHDVPDVVRRWGAAVGVENVEVIACPSPGQGDLLALFAGVVGLAPQRLSEPESALAANPSLSLAQAETLRRVNVSLGDRLLRAGGSYQQAVRLWVTGSALGSSRSPIHLPDEFASWCAEETRRQRDELEAMGVDVVGRREDLVLEETPRAGRLLPTDAEVASVAVAAIADLAHLRWSEIQSRPTEPSRRLLRRLRRRT